MKIVVDKMPTEAHECKYVRCECNALGDRWWSCCKGTHTCTLPEDCPHYISLEKALENMKKI